MFDFIEFGRKIRTYRESLGYTRETLAEMSDITPNHLGEIERGETTSSAKSIIAILNSLNISFSECMGDELTESDLHRKEFLKKYKACKLTDNNKIFVLSLLQAINRRK